MPAKMMKTKIEDCDADDEEAHEKLVAPPDWGGPVETRHCTDILCLFLIIAMWIGMTTVGAYAVANGDYRVLLYPLDHDGNVCGTDFGESNVDMTAFPYLYALNAAGAGVCVAECPSLNGKVQDDLTDMKTLVTYSGLWQADGAELDPSVIKVGNYSYLSKDLTCSAEECYPGDESDSWSSQGVRRGFGYAYYAGDTYDLLHRCYLTAAAQSRIQNLTGAEGLSLVGSTASVVSYTDNFMSNLFADMYSARKYIWGFGFGGSLAISLVYVYLLRFPGLLNALVWGSIFSMIALFVTAGYYSGAKAQDWDEADPQLLSDKVIRYTRITSRILYIVGAVALLIACCLRKQIQLAVGCVKEAGKAINSMVLIMLIPFVQSVGFILFWLVWSYYAVHLASIGSITTQSLPIGTDGTEISIRQFEYDEFITRLGWYMLFCLFWTTAFIIAVGDMIVAMAVSKWYFTVDKGSVTSLTVIASITTTCFFHLGTCAYGSLIIAIIKMLRAALAKLQKKVSEVSNATVAACLLCVCNCCLCYLESCMKYISKSAYLQTAIFGTPFCASARKAFFLILRNAFRIAAISYVSAAVLVVGKLFISTISTGICYFVMMSVIVDSDMYILAGPLVLTFFISYAVADMFMDVFEIAILAILHCFVADEEMFNGRARYAQGDLTQWIDKNAETNG